MRINKESKLLIEKQLYLIVNKGKSIIEVAKYLGTSRQTIWKWLKIYREKGLVELKTHVPINEFSDEFNKNIVKKYKDAIQKIIDRFDDIRKAGMWLSTIRYFNYKEKLGCSNEHIRKVLIANNLISHRTQRKTKRIIRQNIKKALLQTKDIEQAEALREKLELVENHKVYHGKSGVAGYRTESDGCHDHWFGKEKHCLYLIVDSFTGFILDFWIEDQETNQGYLCLYKGASSKYGKSKETRTDQRNGLAQGAIKDMLIRLGIDHSSSSDPTFKPNVERAFQDAQSLLPMYFMDNDINSPQEALTRKEEILQFMNTWLKRDMPKDNSFIELTKEDKEELFIKRERIVANQVSHVSIDNKKWAPFRKDKRVLMNKKVIVWTNEYNQHFIKTNQETLLLKEIKDVLQPKEFTDQMRQIKRERQKSFSHNKMISKKIYLVNKKISQLQELGYQIDKLDIST